MAAAAFLLCFYLNKLELIVAESRNLEIGQTDLPFPHCQSASGCMTNLELLTRWGFYLRKYGKVRKVR